MRGEIVRILADGAWRGVSVEMLPETRLQEVDHAGIEDGAFAVDRLPIVADPGVARDQAGEPAAVDQEVARNMRLRPYDRYVRPSFLHVGGSHVF